MDLRLRSKLRALPILDEPDASPRSRIAGLITFCEPTGTDVRSLESALDKLSDAELDKYSKPQTIASTSQAIAFLADKCSQSPQYLWKRQGSCLLLVSRSRFAQNRAVPGVAFEFVIRTGRSEWTAYRVPDPGRVLGCAVYLERNELIAHSRRPLKSPIRPMPTKPARRLARLCRAVATALRPLPVRRLSLNRGEESEDVAVSGALH